MAAKVKDAGVYNVPALIITPEKAPVITGNYEAIEKTLEKWKAKVMAMKLTEDNLDEVTAIKKAAVAVRNRLKEVIDDTKRRLFNDPKNIFEARARQLTNLVADVEESVDKVLDKLEQGRVEEVNRVLDSYRDKLQEQYALDPPRYAQLEYRKDYYNKTVPKGYSSTDKYWKESLEAQFKELKKAQDALAANIRLIQATCRNEPRLNVSRYIRDLETSDVAAIIEEITAEKQRLQEVDNTGGQTATTSTSGAAYEEPPAEEAAKVVIGIPASINFNSDFPGRTKEMKLHIIYPCDLGDALTELFGELKQHRIKIKRIKEEVVF